MKKIVHVFLGLIVMSLLVVNVSAVSIDWPSFRANQNIISMEAPRSVEETNLDWNVDVTGLYDPTTNMIIVGDYIYVATATNQEIVKIDKAGNIIARATLELPIGYNGSLTYGDGKLFVSMSEVLYDASWSVIGTSSKIQAFSLDSLTSLWISEELSGTNDDYVQAPIVYHDGYIYSGTGDASLTYGKYFALTTEDEDTSNPLEEKIIVWQEDTDSYSWSGGCVIDDTLVFIGNNGHLVSADLKDGTILETRDLSIATGTSVIYNNGYLYIGTKTGDIYMIGYDSVNYFKDSHHAQVAVGGSITGAITIVNGRIYVGGTTDSWNFYAPGFVAVLDAMTLNSVFYQEVDGNVQSSMLVNTGYEGEVYAYFTQNDDVGGVYCIKDTGDTQTVQDVYIPLESMQDYCASSVISDNERLYHINDSGNVMALSKTEPQIIPETPEIPEEITSEKQNVKTGDTQSGYSFIMLGISAVLLYKYCQKRVIL